MSDDQEHNRRHDDQANWFVKAGTLTRSIKFVLSIFALLLACSLLFQFTAERADTQQAQEELDQLTELAEQGAQQRADIRETLFVIKDCVEEGGECFKRGTKQTAEVVSNLNIVTQYAVICGERVDGEMAILDCVNEEVTAYLKVQEAQNSENN